MWRTETLIFSNDSLGGNKFVTISTYKENYNYRTGYGEDSKPHYVRAIKRRRAIA